MESKAKLTRDSDCIHYEPLRTREVSGDSKELGLEPYSSLIFYSHALSLSHSHSLPQF